MAPISAPFAEDEEVMESESPLAVSRPLSVSTTPTLKGLVSTFSAMTGDELERALSRHQERLSRQQYIVRHIAAEKERRRSRISMVRLNVLPPPAIVHWNFLSDSAGTGGRGGG